MMELVLIIISFILVIVGLLGCILPVLPGPPLAYVGLLLVHVTDKVDFSPAQLVCWLLLVVVLQVLDYLTPMLGSKYTGGTEYGNRGSIAGTVLGLFFMPFFLFIRLIIAITGRSAIEPKRLLKPLNAMGSII